MVGGTGDEPVSCRVVGTSTEDGAILRLSSTAVDEVVVSGIDFEEALQSLQGEVERLGYLLLCNRFRRDALSTSMSRQMSGGLRCYLVQPYTDLDVGQIVDSLGPADRKDVVSGVEADAYLRWWKAWFERPLPVRWWLRGFRR